MVNLHHSASPHRKLRTGLTPFFRTSAREEKTPIGDWRSRVEAVEDVAGWGADFQTLLDVNGLRQMS